MVERRGGYIPDQSMRSEHAPNKMYKKVVSLNSDGMRENKKHDSRLYKKNDELFFDKFYREDLSVIEAKDSFEDFLVFIYNRCLDKEGKIELVNFILAKDTRSIKGLLIAVMNNFPSIESIARNFFEDIKKNERKIDWDILAADFGLNDNKD